MTARAVVTWDQYTMAAFDYEPEPTADLDIQVLDQNRRVVASSLSFDNNYEIVNFTTPITGMYTLRVNKFRCSRDPKWLGWAWHFF